MGERTITVEPKQVWRDEDGLKWKVCAVKDGWAHVKRYGYRTSRAIQTNLAWFEKWTLIKDAPASPETEVEGG